MSDEELMQRFETNNKQIKEIHDQLAKILKMLEPLPQMQADIADAKKDSETVKDLVETWNAVKTGGRFIRWIVPIVAAMLGGWAASKAYIARFFA